jgi:hypothetical protein
MADKDRWTELCQRVATSDGLPVREAGPWTEDKLYYWHRYIEITTFEVGFESRRVAYPAPSLP